MLIIIGGNFQFIGIGACSLGLMTVLALTGCGSSVTTALTDNVGQTSTDSINPAQKDNLDPTDELLALGTFSINIPGTINQTLSASDGDNRFRPGKFFDAYNLNLTGVPVGSTVTVTMDSAQFDTYLQLLDRTTTPPTLIAENDDFNGLNSRIVFNTQSGKTYQIRATSFSSGATGAYTVTTVRTVPVPGLRPNDSRYSEQWGYENIRMPTVWNNSTNPRATNRVTVAVLDTGIFAGQADLPSRPADNARILSSGTNVVRGRDAANTPSGESVHGTHVAGTIAALSNNGNGVTGMLWGGRTSLPVTLQSVRVLEGAGSGSGTFFDIVQGIYYAAGLNTSVGIRNQNPAKVINMSLGGNGFCSSSLEAAIRAATLAGSTVVVAAGNAGTSAPQQPASCPSVTLTVGATDQSNQLASFSSFTYSDISAPGVNILSTWRNPTFEFLNGTSMATPHVAGAAAYLLARNPNLKPSQIRALLLMSAESFNDPRMGVGILRLPAAFQSAMNPGTAAIAAGKVDFPTAKQVAARGATDPNADFVPGEIVVTYASLSKSINVVEGQSLSTVTAAVEPDQPTLIKLVGTQSLSESALKEKTLKAIQSLLKSPDVIDAHPNYIFTGNI